MSQDLRDDLVRRGDVMDELVKEYNRRWQEGGLKLAWIEKAVDSARPVVYIREKVSGKWIKNEDGHGWHCSDCKETNYYAYSWNSENGEYEFQDRYCPNCGAQMERSEDGET